MRAATANEQHDEFEETSRYARMSPIWNSHRPLAREPAFIGSSQVEIGAPAHFHLVHHFINLAAKAFQARFFEG